MSLNAPALLEIGKGNLLRVDSDGDETTVSIDEGFRNAQLTLSPRETKLLVQMLGGSVTSGSYKLRKSIRRKIRWPRQLNFRFLHTSMTFFWLVAFGVCIFLNVAGTIKAALMVGCYASFTRHAMALRDERFKDIVREKLGASTLRS